MSPLGFAPQKRELHELAEIVEYRQWLELELEDAKQAHARARLAIATALGDLSTPAEQQLRLRRQLFETKQLQAAREYALEAQIQLENQCRARLGARSGRVAA